MRLALILAGEQDKTVHTAAALTGHDDLLIGKLPAIRNAGQQGHAAFITVQKVNLALLGQGFIRGQALALERIDIRIGFML